MEEDDWSVDWLESVDDGIFARHGTQSAHDGQWEDKLQQAAQLIKLKEFRPWQRRVLKAWDAGRDCLVLSGTGSGNPEIA